MFCVAVEVVDDDDDDEGGDGDGCGCCGDEDVGVEWCDGDPGGLGVPCAESVVADG